MILLKNIIIKKIQKLILDYILINIIFINI